MNKAFVREADDQTPAKCPACGAIGRAVGGQTLGAHLPGREAERLAETSTHFCANPTCDVAYFDGHGQTVGAAALRSGMWPKLDDHQALLCPCLSIRAAEIMADAQRKDPGRVRRILDHARQHSGDCAVATPYGHSCAGEAQKLYLRHMSR